MAEVGINYEHKVFGIYVSKIGKSYKLKNYELWNLDCIKKKLRNKKFLVKYKEAHGKTHLQNGRLDIFKEEQLKNSKKTVKSLEFKENG